MFACRIRRAEGTLWPWLCSRENGPPNWRARPDDGSRYEVLDGELFVTPAPALLHQRALLEL